MANKQQFIGPFPVKKPALLAYLFEKTFMLILLVCLARCENEIDSSGSNKILSGPKDYAYSPVGSRVRDLASFFESMAKENSLESGDHHKEQNVIISLSEAASKLHVLSAGYPLDFKCNKYVKLLMWPNIRTFATINLLMKEAKLFNEMEQNDANLVARLANERSFDAMGKLQTIIQTLESERENMRSIFEPSVQKDLFDCMNYYIYRHQRAISGITYHVREQLNKLSPVIAHPVDSEIALRKFQELIDDTVKLEAEGISDDCDARWIDNLSKLHNLMLENHFEVPILVQEFVTDKKRLSRLFSCNQILDTVKNLEQKVLEIESTVGPNANPTENPEYIESLKELQSFSESKNELVHSEAHQFVHEPGRWKNLEEKSDEEDEISEHQTSAEIEPQVIETPDPVMKPAEEKNLELLGNLKNEAPINQVKEIVLNLPVAKSKDVAKGDLGDDDSAEVVCQKLSSDQNDNLRLTSWASLDIDEASRLARSLNRFHIDCARKNMITNQSRWSLVSITTKLSKWCTNKLQDSSLVREDRTNLTRVLELLPTTGQQIH